jgi:hypothetical protein
MAAIGMKIVEEFGMKIVEEFGMYFGGRSTKSC